MEKFLCDHITSLGVGLILSIAIFVLKLAKFLNEVLFRNGYMSWISKYENKRPNQNGRCFGKIRMKKMEIYNYQKNSVSKK